MIGPSGPAQRREDVELPAFQVMRGESDPSGQVQPSGQSSDAREDEEGLDVQVRQLAPPSRDDTVDVIGRSVPDLARRTCAHLTHPLNVARASRVLTSRDPELPPKRVSWAQWFCVCHMQGSSLRKGGV